MDEFDPLEDALHIVEAYKDATSALSLPEPVKHESKWLYVFANKTCGHKDMAPQPHYEMCEFAEDLMGDCQFKSGGQKFGMVLVPRNTFKTTILVESLVVALLTKNPNLRILITSHKATQASERLAASRKVFESSEEFHRQYGDDWEPGFREAQWSDKAYTVSRRAGRVMREASVTAAAVGADLTGSHFDVIIPDDIVTLQNAYSQGERNKVYEYLTSLYSCLDPNGTLLVVGTRWHADDAYGRVIKADEKRVKAGDAPRYKYLIRSCWDGPNGLYAPSILDHEFLKTIKEDVGPRRFAANYENKTIADEDKTFKKEHLQLRGFDYFHDKHQGYIKTADQMIPVSVAMTWDTAGSKATAKSDYHGIAIRGLDKFGRWWMCEAQGYKGTPSEIISKAAVLIAFYRPTKVYVEAVGSYEWWVGDLQRVLDRIGVATQFVPLSHDGVPKAERIELLEPTWTNHLIILKPEQTMAIGQFEDFSVSSLPTYDDVIDAISAFLKDDDGPSDGVQYIEHPNPIDPEWVEREKRLDKSNEANILNRIFSRRRRRF